jgi:hypothetical protein
VGSPVISFQKSIWLDPSAENHPSADLNPLRKMLLFKDSNNVRNAMTTIMRTYHEGID